MDTFNLALRGTAKDLSNKKIGSLVVTMLYPTVLSYSYKKLGKEQAIQALRQLGSNITDDFLKIYAKNKKNIQEYIKDFFKIFYNSKVKVNKINDKLYHIIDDKCILCMEIALEGLPFHYCISYAGGIERLLNVLSEKGRIPGPKYKYVAETIGSKGIGDPSCIISVRLEEA